LRGVRPREMSDFMRSRLASAFLMAAALRLFPGCSDSPPSSAQAALVIDSLPPGDWTGRCKPVAKETLFRIELHAPQAPWISDKADVLNEAFEREFTKELDRFHVETCHQLLAVSVESLDGKAIEQFSLELANELRAGYAGLNNGLMLLIAPSERQARIEVGCGLEDVISDAQAAEVLGRDLIPAFRRGNFEAGVRTGMQALMALARRKEVPPSHRPSACKKPHS
jgi:uncharacterized protein